MASKTPRPPRIKYIESKDYSLVPVSGAYGGPSPNGDSIVCHFYIDHVDIPGEVELEPNPDQAGAFREPASGLDTRVIRRIVQNGIFVTPEQALVIAEWLRNHATALLDSRRRPNA